MTKLLRLAQTWAALAMAARAAQCVALIVFIAFVAHGGGEIKITWGQV